jgi:3-dehydroquinate dehydratase II
MRFLIINGPNLNLLGTREPETYGLETLDDLAGQWRRRCSALSIGIESFQSNHEGAIIDYIQAEAGRSDGVIINPAALSHTSYAIHDAILAVDKPTVEVHISNIHEREPWRRTSVTAPAADLVIVGRGTIGYLNAIDHLWASLSSPPTIERYGDDDDQVFEFRAPSNPRGVVILIHGGFWRSNWARDIMDPLAVEVHRAGFATANIEYRRGPRSFETSTSDVSTAVDAVIAHAGANGMVTDDLVLVGHSAGGYLAIREAARRRGVQAIGLAPIVDLNGISAIRPDDDPVAAYLGGSADEQPEAWARAAIHIGDGMSVDLIHGTGDETIPIDHTRTLAASHGSVRLAEINGAAHMDLIDPSHSSFGTLLAALGR